VSQRCWVFPSSFLCLSPTPRAPRVLTLRLHPELAMLPGQRAGLADIPVLFYSASSFLLVLVSEACQEILHPSLAAVSAVGDGAVRSQGADAEALLLRDLLRVCKSRRNSPFKRGNSLLQHPTTPRASLLVTARCLLPSLLERGSSPLPKSPLTPCR